MNEPGGGYWRSTVGWLVAAGGSYLFWRWLVGYLWPFALAVALALFVSPLVDRLVSWGFGRTLAVLVALGAALSACVALCAAVIILLTAELLQVTHRLPSYWKTRPWEISRYITDWNRLRGRLGLGTGNIAQIFNGVYQLVGTILRDLAKSVVQLPDLALILVVAALSAFFILRDQSLVRRVVQGVTPPRWRDRVEGLFTAMAGGLFAYLRAEFALVSLTGLSTMGALLVIRAPYAVLVGLTAGLLDMVPFMGPTALLVPWAAASLVTGHGAMAIKLLAVLAVVAIVRQTAEPRLVGRGTGLHPLVVLFSLYLGVRLFGAGGVLIGPVTAVMFKAVAQVGAVRIK